MTRFYSRLPVSDPTRLRSVLTVCFLFLLELPTLLLGQPTSQTFTASGTYVVPAGYTAVVKVEAWGGAVVRVL